MLDGRSYWRLWLLSGATVALTLVYATSFMIALAVVTVCAVGYCTTLMARGWRR